MKSDSEKVYDAYAVLTDFISVKESVAEHLYEVYLKLQRQEEVQKTEEPIYLVYPGEGYGNSKMPSLG